MYLSLNLSRKFGKGILAVGLLLMLMDGWSVALMANELPPKTKTFQIEADSIQEFSGSQEYILKNATVTNGSYTFTADHIEYNKPQQKLKTLGLTTITGKIGEMRGYDVIYSQKTEIVTLSKFTYFDPIKKYYVEAEKAHVYIEGKYIELEDATLTSCNPEKPGWKVFFTHLNYYPESYAYGYNLVYYMHDVPGLYLPVFALPTVTERSSGFLVPEINYESSGNPSKSLGFRLKTPFFWNIRQDQDLTIVPDFIEKRGVGIGLEYNYAFTEGMIGRAYLWDIKENNANRKPADEYRMSAGDNPNPQRYVLHYQHRQHVIGRDTIFLNYQKLSDNEVNAEYFETLKTIEYAEEAEAQYIYPWDNGYLSLEYKKNKTFLYSSIYDTATNYKTALSIEPQLYVTHNFYRFPFEFTRAVLTNRLTNFNRQVGWVGQRNIFKPGFFLDKRFNFLNTSFAYTEYLYNYNVNYRYADNPSPGDSSEKSKAFNYSVSNVDLRLAVEFYRPFYNDSNLPQSEFSITPSISLHYTQDQDQLKAIAASPGTKLNHTGSDYLSYGGMFDGNDLNYGYQTVTNRLDFTYQTTEKNNRRKIWQISLYQIYDLWRKKNKEETESFFSGPFIEEVYRENPYGEMKLPLRIQAYFSPSVNYSFAAFSRYDERLNQFIETNVSANITGNHRSRLNVAYNRNAFSYKELNNALHSARHEMRLHTSFHFLSYWKLSYNATWNISRLYDKNSAVDSSQRQMIFSSIRLDKNDPCYDFFIEYNETLKSATTATNTTREYIDRTVKFSIEILNTWS